MTRDSGQTLTAPGAARTLILGAIGALIGLLVAGFGLFTAKGTSTLIVPAEDVALVNQQPISRIDFTAQLQTLYATDLDHAAPEQKRKVLDDMIREELMVQRGKELDVASFAPEVRNAMVAAVEQESAIAAYADQPSETKLTSYFDAHRDAFSTEGILALTDLVFPNASAAASAAAALRQGRTIDQAATEFRGHESKKVDGKEFYFAAKIHLGDALFAAARALPPGGISDPIEADGVHVLVMKENTPPIPPKFEEVRARVLGDYRRDTARRLEAENGDFLRKRANILISDDLR